MASTRIPALALAAATLVACDPAAARSSDERPAEARAATLAGSGPGTAVQRAPFQSRAASIDLGFTRGPEDAAIAVVEFSDFGCPYCARFARATFPAIVREYIDRGTVRWRYVPVVFGFAGGELMGSAAVCAADLAGEPVFWDVHDLFYTRQQALRGPDARPRVLDWVAELGVDRDELDACIDAPETAELLRQHREAAIAWYVRGTPTFVVNGVPMSGAAPPQFFRKVFDTVLDPSGL
ncbi:MAG: thioredoxin domain-containing protein [Longimicrobiales bacterium]|nr:thioredoxin domain-containing protein [Longimicrobiales bacterium]